jgi:hypothetical protein
MFLLHAPEVPQEVQRRDDPNFRTLLLGDVVVQVYAHVHPDRNRPKRMELGPAYRLNVFGKAGEGGKIKGF